MKKLQWISVFFVMAAVIPAVLTGCPNDGNGDDSTPGPVAVTFESVTPNGQEGVLSTDTLTLTFSAAVPGL